MAEKETKFCSDCIHYDICYKIEHYGRDLEDTSACKQFIGKDVVPVKHGHWDVGYFHDRVCSFCLHPDNDLNDFPHDYCPNCGAKMDGEEQSNDT